MLVKPSTSGSVWWDLSSKQCGLIVLHISEAWFTFFHVSSDENQVCWDFLYVQVRFISLICPVFNISLAFSFNPTGLPNAGHGALGQCLAWVSSFCYSTLTLLNNIFLLDPKLPSLLKMLLWAQNLLDEKASYPRINNLSTAALEDPTVWNWWTISFRSINVGYRWLLS